MHRDMDAGVQIEALVQRGVRDARRWRGLSGSAGSPGSTWLEAFVLLDRARHLEERGFAVETIELFPTSISPRNLALVASRR